MIFLGEMGLLRFYGYFPPRYVYCMDGLQPTLLILLFVLFHMCVCKRVCLFFVCI